MKIKCSNCGCKDLVKTYMHCPTDDGFVDCEKAYVVDKEYHKIQVYLCKKCGHIEFYAVKIEESKQNKNIIG